MILEIIKGVDNLYFYIGIAVVAIILALIGYVTDKKAKKNPKNNANPQ
jgi:mannose/fructose/N-acetylgalactosamine-specific phosphotransferase system component IIC